MAKEDKSLVEPIESVESAPKKTGEPCWNCDGNLDKESVCEKCGFDRKLVYNLDLEATKTKEKE